jgi:glycolate oxidase
MDTLTDLEGIVPGGVVSGREQLIPYLTDASHFEGDQPLAVVFPSTTEQVSSLLAYCSSHGIAVVPRGGGTSLTGASVLKGKGVVVDMLRMDRIIKVSTVDKYAACQPGVRLDDLNETLSRQGHFFPPDPGSSIAATVGGVISTNAGGLRCLRYGTTKDWILGMEVVLPGGEVVQFGNRTLKSRIGYDLTSLIVGSEGTLGIVTSAYLKIANMPEGVSRVVAFYTGIASLGRAVADIRNGSVQPLVAEFLDRKTLEAVARGINFEFPREAQYMLLLDIEGPPEAMDRYLTEVRETLSRSSPIHIVQTKDEEEMRKLYMARKGAYLKLRRSSGDSVLIGDIVVPPSTLSEVLEEISAAAERMKIYVALFGHIGDGNIHANIFVDMNNKEEADRVGLFHRQLAEIALAHGGSVSAEHGIGIEKRELLQLEYSRRHSEMTVEVMKRIKTVIDPEGIMNPGKVFF